MELNWRNDTYEFFPKTITGGKDRLTQYSNIGGNIYGADTESVQLDDRYEVQCFTFSAESDGESLIYVPERDNVFPTFLEWFLTNYEHELFDYAHHFIYYHNLEYDWLQMIKNDHRLLEMAKIGVSPSEDIKLFQVKDFHITLKKNALFAGSAPHIRLRIKKGRKAFTLYIQDTFSFFPGSLEGIAKDLNLGIEKMTRQLDIGQVDYRTMKDGENDGEKEYFEKYAKVDALVTRLTGERIRELHVQAGMTKIRPSAPSYAINLLFHMMDEEQSIVTGVHDESIMQLILDTYRGGRTGGIYHGKVDNISVLDFHSSYPASMLPLPSFSPSMIYARLDEDELELENVLEILKETGNAFLTISGREVDSKYPSLLTTYNGKLTPIYGEFENISTTGYEFYVGVMSGGLQDIVIHECVVLLDTEDDVKLPFNVFAKSAYQRKQDAIKASVEYISAKLGLNASYGKLIESRSQTLIGASDSRDYLPYIEGMEKEFGNYYYSKYDTALQNGQRLIDIYDDIMDELEQSFEEDVRENMKVKMFGDFSISGRVYGRHVTPAGASLITGCSRARLLCAMKALKAIYWDTDSVFVPNLVCDVDAINETLAITNDWLPMGTVPIRIGEELGELDIELANGYGYLAGTKRYYLDAETAEKPKRATHGIPALPKDLTKDIIQALATGQNFKYESKPKPLKAKESKTPEDIGSFVAKWFDSQFRLDDRLSWERGTQGWDGNVRPFVEMPIQRTYKDEEIQQFYFALDDMKH
ncbi:putative DNA-directed DNA polymerase [Lysinibacillus phage phiG2]|nr:putative DNA-directed DNA polymerase [Lysinibacillus phage phiG2]